MNNTQQQELPIEWVDWVDQIEQFTQSQQPLMLIIGKSQKNKNAFIEKTMRHLRTLCPIIHINSKSTTTPESIKKSLFNFWSKVAANEGDTLDAQLQTLLGNLKSERPHVLIIHQVDPLPTAALAFISQLVDQQNSKLHVILSGEPGLEDYMSKLTGHKVPQITLDAAAPKSLWQQYGIRAVALAGLLLTTFYMNWHYHHQHNSFEKPPNNAVLFAADKQPLPLQPIKPKAPAATTLTKLATPKYAVTKKPINMAPTNVTPVPTKPQPFYTLQLMSEANQAALQHFASAHNLRQNAQVYPTHYKGKPWYLLGYGHYSNIANAKHALAHLPNDIKMLKPWIRPMHDHLKGSDI
ncbi:MAG: SPOR domain-containing protein [Gammaproteobacteria bacterium]|nr:SPOR domain-containing protein [Gammaproteobacteria bacterium]